ncbi:MAG: TIGR01906 family membrane protein [Anaerolineae bacterium]
MPPTSPSPVESEAVVSAQATWLIRTLQAIIILALPPVLVLTSVRLVMTEAFLQVEYHRPGFPDDRFGFTRDDRLHYAPYAVRYLHNDADISYLGQLAFPNGQPLFTDRELQHMEDVKEVTRAAFRILTALAVVLALSALWLARHPSSRRWLWRALSDGALLTIFLILGLLVLSLAAWQFFFDNFHALFFEGDTWIFSTSDTLIRLFPQQFWFDAALSVGMLSLIGSLISLFCAYRLEQRTARRRKTNGAT